MTSETESNLAKEALILDLFDGWPNATPTADTLRAYVQDLAGLSVDAVGRSVQQFRSGRVERNNSFPPPSPELASNAREWERALILRAQPTERVISYKPGEPVPVGYTPHGGTIDFQNGSGSVNLVGLTREEQDRVFELKGFAPDGRSLSGMALEHIKAALNQGDLAAVEGGKSFAMPRLGRMP